MSRANEHELIARFFRPLADASAARGLADDAAVLRPPPGRDLVFTKDGIAEGIHFLPGEIGDFVARKALRVNLSDLAAMGADPLGYLVLLALPDTWRETWVESFAAGLAEDQVEFGIALYGGDTIRASGLTVSITAIGSVPSGYAVGRAGAQEGDVVFVSGTIGDGALGLRAARGELPGLDADAHRFLVERYRRPRPRCALASVLREHANSAIDISDGLVGDLDKLCLASDVAARIHASDVPLSAAARAVTADKRLFELCLTGGDDYEILCTVASERRDAFAAAATAAGVPVTLIGRIEAGLGPSVFIGMDGQPMRFARRSFSHTG